MTQDDRPFCQDCGLRSDLGLKCRECYAKWSRRLWADIPRELAKLNEVGRELNKTAQPLRKEIASQALGYMGGPQLSEKPQDLLKRVKAVLEGPYKENLEACLQAIRSANDEKARRAASTEVE